MSTDAAILQQMLDEHLQQMHELRAQHQSWVAGFFAAIAEGRRYDIPDQSRARSGGVSEAEGPPKQLDGTVGRADPAAERGSAIADAGSTTSMGAEAAGS